MEDFNVKAVKSNHLDFPVTFEEIDEYRIYTMDNIWIGTVQVRYNNRTKETDYRAYGVGVRGRACAWTDTEDKAIERIKKASIKPVKVY